MRKIEIVDDDELNALGQWFDEHIEETNAECAEAEKNGKVYTLAELGAKDGSEAIKKLREKPARKMYSFRLPIVLVEGLKQKAKREHKPYQRLVNDALWAVIR
ncbi:hypothetical protein AGMMS49938_04120 [Fibrobacterales bacterium]|nr:hypothetical protein AGMMS49938_04120 [Fibrobacterales bacterium]